MPCREMELVDAFVAGELPSDVVLALEVHLEECEACFAEVAQAIGTLSSDSRASLTKLSDPRSRVTRCLRGESTGPVGSSAESSRSAIPLQVTIGSYVIAGVLGRGGMGVVYRARHVHTGRPVALKAVKAPQLASFASLRQEIDFLKGANHSGIVKIVDYDLSAGDPWYAMELLDGQTLADRNREQSQGRRSAAEAAGQGPSIARAELAAILRFYAALCEPLSFVHAAGIVHCDLKPSNVFLRNGEQPVLMDFGLAARARGMVGREALHVTSRLRGTLPYMAPELIRGQLPDVRADIYALGCMLYESVTGEPPFVADVAARTIELHMHATPAPASARMAGVPAALDDLLMRMLAKQQTDRFGHVADLGPVLWRIAAEVDPSVEGDAARGASADAEQSPAQLFRPMLVGRQAEFDRLTRHARGASAPPGAILLISGESGIGKTFLATEVSQLALLRGARVITGECTPLAPALVAQGDAGSAPLQPFRRLFEAIRDQCRERGPAETDRLLGRHRGLLTSHVPALGMLGGGAGDGPPEPLPAMAARERVTAALAEMLAVFAGERRLVLALDDLQWADDLTLAVLDHLDEAFFRRTPIVILGTYRTDEASEALERLGNLAKKSWIETYRLQRLGRSEISGMISGMLSIAVPPEPLVDFIHTHAEGVPFFAAEYLRALVGEGALVRRDGAWNLEPARDRKSLATLTLSPPNTLAELLARRIEQLSAETRAALGAAAVIGRRFSVALMEDALGRAPGEVEVNLAEAAARQIVERDPAGGEYRFLHDKIREALYEAVPPARRAPLHLGVGRALERSHANQPGIEDQLGRIAHHFREAGDAASALPYLVRAGEQALAIGASREAARFFREALDLAAAQPELVPPLGRARLERQRGEALQGMGMMAESADALQRAAGLLGRPLPKGPLRFVGLLLREVFQQVLHRVLPRPLLRNPPGRAPLLQEVSRVFDRLLQASYYLGRDQDLVFSTAVALNSSERAPPAQERPIAYANAAIMAAVLPLPKLAEYYFRLGGDFVRQTPDAATESWLCMHEGVYRMGRGERDKSVACLERVIELSEKLRFFRRMDEARSARSNVDIIAGYHDRVLDRLALVDEQTARRGDAQILSWSLLQRIECLLMQEAPVPPALLERIRGLASDVGRPEHIWRLAVEASLAHARGEGAEAMDLAERAGELIAVGPPVHIHCMRAYARLAEIGVSLLRQPPSPASQPRARKLAVRACATLSRAAGIFPVGVPMATLHAGMLDLVRGKNATGVARVWRRGVASARAMGIPYHEARLHLALAGLLPADHPDRTGHERQAAALLHGLNLPVPGLPAGGVLPALYPPAATPRTEDQTRA